MYKKRTRDESFLALLYALALERNNLSLEIDRYVVGRAMNLSVRMTDPIVRHAAQANFIEKGEGDAIYLTPYGIAWVEEHLLEGAHPPPAPKRREKR